MHPILVRIGPLPVHWYGVMMAAGFLAGYLNWLWLTRKERRNTNLYADLLFWIIVAGIAGARLAYVLGDIKYFLANPWQIIRVDQGGLTYYGGVVAAAVAILLFSRRRSTSILNVLDLVVTAVPLAHAFGRIGCFLNGCCYGKVHTGACSVTFPQHSLAWHDHVTAGLIDTSAPCSLPVYPTQLIEAGWNLTVYLLVVLAFRRRPHRGFPTGLYLLAYPVGRFFIEFLRGDERLEWHGLSGAQIMSIGLVLLGVGILAANRGRAAGQIGLREQNG